ncbi:MAG: 4Fe-4S dicluster domain-containing protein [Clostridiales bacterium]|nr:4Fe-4S dicluster domain-containing protein [Clostridiales bacterium]
MISNSEFVSEAKKLGFAKTFFLPAEDIPTQNDRLISSPKSLLPGANTLILLIMPYRLISELQTKDGVISPYYRASQRAHIAVKHLAGLIINDGSKAVCSANIPLKNAIVKNNIGIQRNNSLTYIDGLGSAFHIQSIITDAVFEHSDIRPSQTSGNCKTCLRCVSACPTSAISPEGAVDPTRCLRWVSEQKVIPFEYESILANRLLGCDVCQTVCPFNCISNDEPSFIVPLEMLLNGELGELPETIGSNLARKTRMMCKACVLAANNQRTDLLPQLRELSASKDEIIASAAAHAINRMEERL